MPYQDQSPLINFFALFPFSLTSHPASSDEEEHWTFNFPRLLVIRRLVNLFNILLP